MFPAIREFYADLDWTVKSALRPGNIALGIASVTSSASFLTLRTFINNILPNVIVNYLHEGRNSSQFYLAHTVPSMNFSRISLDVETISHRSGVAISGYHTLIALTLKLSSPDVFRDSR